ncbi:MAG: AAA family ATPase [Candidatus Baldrarchaeia archaeon]
MSSEFREKVREKVKEIQQKVYIKDEILEKIVALFLSLKEGRFPSKKPPRGILFYGPPGTGKTLLMKTLAEKLGLSEPIIIRGPEIISQYYGKSELRLRQIFALAKERAEEENLAIIFIDEIDSIAPRRDLTRGELEPRLVGQLLSLMDGLEREVSKGHVLVIGSTNRPEALDPALRRPGRFDLEIEFDPPDVNERREILKIILNNYAPGRYENIDFDEIAELTIGFTGADLLQLVNEALLKAALEGREKITHEDLLKVKNRIKPSALREFNLERPKDRSKEISDERILSKIEEIATNFSTRPCFKPILLEPDLWHYSDKIASTIAYRVCERRDCPYIVARASHFRSRWFGETEHLIRQFFEKIKRHQPCVVYIKGFDAIGGSREEHLHGTILEIAGFLDEFCDNNIEVLLICSIAWEIDPLLRGYFISLKQI